jgi:hypothetical protein
MLGMNKEMSHFMIFCDDVTIATLPFTIGSSSSSFLFLPRVKNNRHNRHTVTNPILAGLAA